jgi:hypothetical protein
MIETNSPYGQGFALFWTKTEAQAAFARFWAPEGGVIRLWQGRFWQDTRGVVMAARGKKLLDEVQGEPADPWDELTEEDIRAYDDNCEEYEDNRRRKIAESLEY